MNPIIVNLIFSVQEGLSQTEICIPISTFADNLDFKVVNATGGRDGVGGSHRRCVFVVLPMTCKRRKTQQPYQIKAARSVCLCLERASTRLGYFIYHFIIFIMHKNKRRMSLEALKA